MNHFHITAYELIGRHAFDVINDKLRISNFQISIQITLIVESMCSSILKTFTFCTCTSSIRF